MAEDSRGRLESLVAWMPKSMTKKTAETLKSREARNRRAIEAAVEGRSEDDGANGVDAGEVGKKWDETFPK